MTTSIKTDVLIGNFHSDQKRVKTTGSMKKLRKLFAERKAQPVTDSWLLVHDQWPLVPLWFPLDRTVKDITQRRAWVKAEWKKKYPTHESLKTKVALEDLVVLINHAFLDGQLLKELKKQNQTMQVMWGDEVATDMKKGCAGHTDIRVSKAMIVVHPGMIQIPVDPVHGEACGGIVCWDLWDCLIALMEHELVHLLLICFRHIKQEHGKDFKDLQRALFNHVVIYHSFGLGSGTELSKQDRARDDKRQQIEVGQLVQYQLKSHDEKTKSKISDTTSKMIDAVVVYKADKFVAVIHEDGRLLQKLDFLDILVSQELDSTKKRKRDTVPNSVLDAYATRFLNNKKQLKVGQAIRFETHSASHCDGVVLAKKTLHAEISLSPSISCLIPYHSLEVEEEL